MTVVDSPPPTTLRTLLAPGLSAVRRYWKPFLLLQSAGLTVVFAYYTSPRVSAVCDRMSQFKDRHGLWFIALAAAFAGGLMPEFAKAIVMGDRKITRQRLRNVGFVLAIYALNGILTDVQYRGIAWLIGSDARFVTAVRKMLFDQFVTTPIYGTPYWVVLFLLRANRFNPITTIRQLNLRWYATRVIPLLIPSWCFWIPMTLLIYSLPGPLQFCLFCFVSAAWSLVMVFIAAHEARAEVQSEAQPSQS